MKNATLYSGITGGVCYVLLMTMPSLILITTPGVLFGLVTVLAGACFVGGIQVGRKFFND